MSFKEEKLLDMLTSPTLSHETNWDEVLKYCNLVLKDHNGPSGSVNLILDRIRHPNPAIALRALVILEAVVKNTGPPTHDVVGKFKFLNELIKLASPKHTPDTSDEVRERILALIQRWNFTLPSQPKIKEAYQMLKQQGGIRIPDHDADDHIQVPAGYGYKDQAGGFSSRRSEIESDEKKAKLLEKLLKSTDPNDLVKANKLIKRMVEEDAKKKEKAASARAELDLARTNVKLLDDMLSQHKASDPPLTSNDLIQDVRKACLDVRPKLYTIAGDLDEKDPLLGDVLSCSDDLTRVLDTYTSLLAQGNGHPAPPPSHSTVDSLLDLDFSFQSIPAQPSKPAQPLTNTSLDLAFGSLNMPSTPNQTTPSFPNYNLNMGPGPQTMSMPMAPPTLSFPPSSLLYPPPIQPGPPMGTPFTPVSIPVTTFPMMSHQPLLPSTPPPAMLMAHPTPGPQLVPLTPQNLSAPTSSSNGNLLTPVKLHVSEPPPLASLDVSLDSIKPGPHEPIVAFDKNGVRVMFLLAANPPHPFITVAVASFLNFNSFPIQNFNFQVAVPKTLQVSLRNPSATDLPATLTNGAPSPVTQIMLISNPTQVPIRLRFKISYFNRGLQVDETGDCSSFPAPA